MHFVFAFPFVFCGLVLMEDIESGEDCRVGVSGLLFWCCKHAVVAQVTQNERCILSLPSRLYFVV